MDDRTCLKAANHRGWHRDDHDKGMVVEWMPRDQYQAGHWDTYDRDGDRYVAPPRNKRA